MQGAFDLQFSPTAHVRLLLRLDRGFNVQRAVADAVKEGDRVLDAGTGTGLLSFIAHRAGASEILAIDREHIGIAKRLAEENGFGGLITFMEGDLRDIAGLDIQGHFDVLFAFVYSNHIVLDAERSALILSLKQRFCTPQCTIVPNRVRYKAYACEWTEQDFSTQDADLREAFQQLESCYRLKFDALHRSVWDEMAILDSRANSRGRHPWQPFSPIASARFDRSALRLLSTPVDYVEIRYDDLDEFPGYPETLALPISSSGSLTGVIFIQELLFRDTRIWTSEAFSRCDMRCLFVAVI
jgi:predicted RNA methylase